MLEIRSTGTKAPLLPEPQDSWCLEPRPYLSSRLSPISPLNLHWLIHPAISSHIHPFPLTYCLITGPACSTCTAVFILYKTWHSSDWTTCFLRFIIWKSSSAGNVCGWFLFSSDSPSAGLLCGWEGVAVERCCLYDPNVTYQRIWKATDAILLLSVWLIIHRWSKSHLNATALSPCLTPLCRFVFVVFFYYLYDLFFLFLFHHPFVPLFFPFRINEAADFKDHKIQVASCLISLKVEPSPALSVNLSGAPLIKIVLTHVLVRFNTIKCPTFFVFHIWLCLGHSHWEKGELFQLAWVAVGCGTPTLSLEGWPQSACGYSGWIPPYEIYQLYIWHVVM